MAKGKGRSRGQRGASVSPLDPLSGLLPDPGAPELVEPLDDFSSLQDIQDLRLFSPEAPFQAPRSVSTLPLRVGRPGEFGVRADRTREFMEHPSRMARQQNAPLRWAHSAQFVSDPVNAVHCVRRKVRREVMFSLPRRKRSKGAGAKRRRNEWSDVNC